MSFKKLKKIDTKIASFIYFFLLVYFKHRTTRIDDFMFKIVHQKFLDNTEMISIHHIFAKLPSDFIKFLISHTIAASSDFTECLDCLPLRGTIYVL